ncbi:DegT/DnrJ/EryC1/StrS family aminotransferase [Gammaproteobacteria bacterium]|nr:DegT/DnrJ/EryC1/StrS family aminotransferase [Gammaproteobacteria bacterium]
MEFIDLNQQNKKISNQLNKAISDVINGGQFIQGPAVKELESKLSEYVGADCVTCANGTDAIYIALRALGVKAGDEVLVPSFTWVSTAEVVKLLDAIPIFVEVDSTFNIDLMHASTLINKKTKGIIAVSMFGTCGDLSRLKKLTTEHGIFLIEDAAQSFGAMHNNQMSCSIADISTTSFFPAKPLGCYGDGGAIFSNNPDLIELCNAISKHGQQGRYNYITVGMNSRLDTIQAAILLEKLKIFEEEVFRKNQIAFSYMEHLCNCPQVLCPIIPDTQNRAVWAQYTLILKIDDVKNKRKKIMEDLKSRGIPTALYYPAPLHLQSPYKTSEDVNLPVTEKISDSVLSLPMHAYLSNDDITFIAENVIQVLK